MNKSQEAELDSEASNRSLEHQTLSWESVTDSMQIDRPTEA